MHLWDCSIFIRGKNISPMVTMKTFQHHKGIINTNDEWSYWPIYEKIILDKRSIVTLNMSHLNKVIHKTLKFWTYKAILGTKILFVNHFMKKRSCCLFPFFTNNTHFYFHYFSLESHQTVLLVCIITLWLQNIAGM